uniref:Solute carrier family 25 member 10 n=2 Tax=Pan TaxID=9596 RepID=H2QE30_PANTR
MAAEARVSRWYFGGLASCGAACCTHPLDLLKVHLQTQQEVKLRMTGMALRVVRTDGILALYNGLSASLCRQMTYSLTRFAIYETVRDRVAKGSQGPLPFHQKVLLGSVSGLAGGFVGTPADLVNVRMQNDVKLPQGQRRNYAHALDGLYRVAREEGLRRLFSGATMASSRGALVTVGQLYCRWMCHVPVSAPGCAEDSPDELQGGVGRFPLRRGDSEARASGLLQGPRPSWHPPHPPHRAHFCVSGTATQKLWHQSAILTSRGNGWAARPATLGSSKESQAQHLLLGPRPPRPWPPVLRSRPLLSPHLLAELLLASSPLSCSCTTPALATRLSRLGTAWPCPSPAGSSSGEQGLPEADFSPLLGQGRGIIPASCPRCPKQHLPALSIEDLGGRVWVQPGCCSPKC